MRQRLSRVSLFDFKELEFRRAPDAQTAKGNP
jgi:hypothetical protein